MAAVAGKAGAPGPGRSAGRAPAGPSAAGVVGAGPRPWGRRIRAGAPAGRRGERRRAWARLARVLGRRCRRRVVAGTGQQSKARARHGRGAGAADRRGAGAAEREGGGGGARRRRLQTAGAGSVCWNRLGLGRGPAFLVMGLCRVLGDDGTRQRIFLFFFKFLCRVPHDLAPGKLFFFVFFTPFFCGDLLQ